MFGYIVVNEDELKIKDHKKYRAYYCGLCSALKDRFKAAGQLTLSYDMTFLVILLSGLYEPATEELTERCVPHPATKHRVLRNEFSDYVAGMNILLSYYKCKDDWDDEKKVTSLAAMKGLEKAMSLVRSQFPDKSLFIERKLREIRACEKRKETNLDIPAGLFGEIMAEIFTRFRDEWHNDLWQTGFYLGKFIYLLDAFDDMEEDRKTGNYNVFLLREASENQDYNLNVEEILTMMISECCRAFERLPIIENLDILRNILYSGLWSKYYIRIRKNAEEADKKRQKA